MRVAGFGCRPGTDAATLCAALEAAEALAGPVAALATIAPRLPELRPLALARNLPLYVARVGGIVTPTQSPRVAALYATGSVAEAAALAIAGPGARIVVARLTSPCGRATVAIAESQKDQP